MSDVKVTKRSPLTLEHFDEFFRLLPDRTDSERSWTVTREDIEDREFDLKAVNPNMVVEKDTRTPKELLDVIEKNSRKVDAAVSRLRQLL